MGQRFEARSEEAGWSVIDHTARFQGGRVLTRLDEQTARAITLEAEADPETFDGPGAF